MTELSHLFASAVPVGDPRRTRIFWRLAPYACVVAAAAVGLAIGRAVAPVHVGMESQLVLLLRFMAAMKAAGVLAAAAALHWRLSLPIRRAPTIAYFAALGAMACAPGLIWSLGSIATGALLFHAGLLTFLIVAWRDDGLRRGAS